jgi:nickel-dependent lactate racemase
MRISLGYDDVRQYVELPDKNLLGLLEQKGAAQNLDADLMIKKALDHPINSPRVEHIVRPGEKLVIISSDKTRPMPTKIVLPHLLDRLEAAGCSWDDITLIFGLGAHGAQTSSERRALAGEQAWGKIACIDADTADCAAIGITSRGTPVEIARCVASADRRICMGNIEYHYFAGYSGGAKAIFPGVASLAGIFANHRLMSHPDARAGVLLGNPVREDLEQAAKLCGIDFILNVVLDGQKQISGVFAGHPVDAHLAGCGMVDHLFGIEIAQKADIVLVSQGGAPKDLNLYQTQKALDNARHAVKEGGIIILVGSCKEGLGNRVFERWFEEAESPVDIIERGKSEFQLGGHKAVAIASVLEFAEIFLVSDLAESVVRKMFMTPFCSAQRAFDEAMRKKGKDAAVWVMPSGGSTLPILKV